MPFPVVPGPAAPPSALPTPDDSPPCEGLVVPNPTGHREAKSHAALTAAAVPLADSGSPSASVALPSLEPPLRSRVVPPAAAAAARASPPKGCRPPSATPASINPAALASKSAAPFLCFRRPAPTGTLRSIPPAVQYRWHPRQKYRGCLML